MEGRRLEDGSHSFAQAGSIHKLDADGRAGCVLLSLYLMADLD